MNINLIVIVIVIDNLAWHDSVIQVEQIVIYIYYMGCYSKHIVCIY